MMMPSLSDNKINNIKALSFDLDDTLYDNKPVINKAYQLLYAFLVEHYPKVSELYTLDVFKNSALNIKYSHPTIADLNAIRRLHISSTLESAGYSINSSLETQAFDVFWQARQDIKLFPEAAEVLTRLAERFPLVAISNGNACIKTMGLGQYFQFSVSPLDTGQAKPHSSMFLYATEKLGIQPQQLLHIGDKIKIDVDGAHNAGCRSIWFNPKSNNRNVDVDKSVADGVIENLSALLVKGFF